MNCHDLRRSFGVINCLTDGNQIAKEERINARAK